MEPQWMSVMCTQFWLCQMADSDCHSVKGQCFAWEVESLITQQEHFQCMPVSMIWTVGSVTWHAYRFWKLSESCGCAGKFLPLTDLHSFFQGKVPPCLPSQSPQSSLRCNGEDTHSDFYRAGRVMYWETPCSFPVYYISSWLLSSAEPKWTFDLAVL